MAHETEWFQGRSEDEHERCFRWRVGFALYAAIAAALILVPMLAGCSVANETKVDDPKICYLKTLGRTPDGMVVVVQQCMTEEAFTEMQGK